MKRKKSLSVRFPLLILIVLLVSILILKMAQDQQDEQRTQGPQPKAQERGYKENEWGKEDYSRFGFAGNWNDISEKDHYSAFDARKITPMCNTEYIVWGGDTIRVADCYDPPKPPTVSNYQKLCSNSLQKAETACQKLCANTVNTEDPCPNWQLHPKYYTEWGCDGKPPPAPKPNELYMVPHQYCNNFAGCSCTKNPG